MKLKPTTVEEDSHIRPGEESANFCQTKRGSPSLESFKILDNIIINDENK